MTVTAKKFFSETVPIGSSAVSMGSLMRTAGYGFEKDANNDITTQPSMDSFTGISSNVIPTSDLYVGNDQYVRDADGAGPPRTYKGVVAAAGQPYPLEKFCRGVVDPDGIYFYSPSGAQDIILVFVGI